MTTGSYIHNGNAKTGKRVGLINRMPGATCPGASELCARVCYAKRPLRWQSVVKAYTAELALPSKPRPYVRIHASGDFDSVEYIQEIHAYAVAHPETLFWAYTRSWRVASLLPALENLRALPNVQLFASMDETIGDVPPSNWRKAWISSDIRKAGPICMEQTGVKPDCGACGYCFKGQSKDITFQLH